MKDYFELLNEKAVGLNRDDAEKYAENICSTLENLPATTERKIVLKILGCVREKCNLILAICQPQLGFVPSCLTRVMIELDRLRARIVDANPHGLERERIEEEILEMVDDLGHGAMVEQEEEFWKLLEYSCEGCCQTPQKLIKELPQDVIDKFHEENAVKIPDTIVLEEEEIKYLQSAVLGNKLVSITQIQIRLGIGYPKAAKLFDKWEKLGFIKKVDLGEGKQKTVVCVKLEDLG